MIKKITVIVLFLLLLVTYTFTTAPYLQAGDSAEMATAAITLGVPHQPSYPLYVLPGYILTKLPIPYFPALFPQKIVNYKIDQNNTKSILIYRSGLTSAISQALTGVFLFLMLLELMKYMRLGQSLENESRIGEILIALVSTVVYSFSETIWLYATKPEVFALNNLFICSTLYFAFAYLNNKRKKKPNVWFFFWYGLAISHHQTIIILLPALILVQYFKTQNITGERLGKITSRWASYSFEKKFNKLFPYIFFSILGIIPYCVLLWIFAQRKPLLNWGEISNLVGILRALIRADYGTIGAYLSNTANNTVMVDQIPFFTQHLFSDFSFYTIFLSFVGLIALYKSSKKIWAIIMTLLTVSGPIFLMYANFSLVGEFSQATVVRFYMLPEISLIMLFACCAYLIYRKTAELTIFDKQHSSITTVSKIILAGLLIAIGVIGLIKNVPLYDNLTYQYVKTAITATEPNALILVTGDIPNMTMQYMQAVEGEKKNRIIFSPGQFHLKWFQKQLKERYPNTKIPDPLPGKQFTSPKQVIDANFEKQPIYITPEFVEIDPKIQEEYVVWPKGLLLKVEKKGVEYKLENYREENERIYKDLNLDDFVKLRQRKYQLESPLIFYYARHFYNLGAVYNSVHLYDDALREYQRAIAIDPLLSESYKAIGYILWFTPDYPDKNGQLAVEYFNKYLQTTKTVDDQYIAVQNAIKEIIDTSKKEQEELKKQSEKEATSSSEATQSANPSEEPAAE
jgi:tetratricopeptide (TPR) repeat protein